MQQLHGHIVYSKDQLIVLKSTGLTEHQRSPLKSGGLHTEDSGGKRDGSRQQRLREKRRWKPCLPSRIMATVRSLANKDSEGELGVESDVLYRDMARPGHT